MSSDSRSFRIEIVYYRYHHAYKAKCPTVKDALSRIEGIEDYGTGSTVGVFKNGEPLLYDAYVDAKPPTDEQREHMAASYAEAEEE